MGGEHLVGEGSEVAQEWSVWGQERAAGPELSLVLWMKAQIQSLES